MTLAKRLPSLGEAPETETFTDSQIENAVEQFLKFGEDQYQKSQEGYYSGSGWAARCLRYHLEQLKAGHNA